MNKQEQRINELAEALENNWANEYEVLTYPKIAEALVNAGYGNIRHYRQTLIELYLKGDTAGLLKFVMEEV
jgi:hypothetical protein